MDVQVGRHYGEAGETLRAMRICTCLQFVCIQLSQCKGAVCSSLCRDNLCIWVIFVALAMRASGSSFAFLNQGTSGRNGILLPEGLPDVPSVFIGNLLAVRT